MVLTTERTPKQWQCLGIKNLGLVCSTSSYVFPPPLTLSSLSQRTKVSCFGDRKPIPHRPTTTWRETTHILQSVSECCVTETRCSGLSDDESSRFRYANCLQSVTVALPVVVTPLELQNHQFNTSVQCARVLWQRGRTVFPNTASVTQ